ncbi:MAG: HupE/UreJ family protein [Saprospiraceae bacterium]
MNGFSFYLNFGFDHILDMDALDHIAFLVALCAIYNFRQWKTLLVLVTAFTIGHSITLGLAATDTLRFKKEWIEFLIPVTILLTALHNVFRKGAIESASAKDNYLLALGFGFIHGMGFSNTLKSMLMPGEESQFIQQLLAFNIGVELGQLIIVGIILAITYLALDIFKVKQRDWNLFVSGAAAGVAVVLILGRF